MKIKINKKRIKSAVASFSGVKEDSKLYHPVILLFGSIALIILGVNIFGNIIFSSQVVYVSLRSQNEMTGILNSGTPAPGFILPNLTNGKVSDLNFRQSPLIILFWTSWNQLSVDQLNVVDGYLSNFPDTEVRVLAINSQEDKNSVSSFIKRGGYKIPIALDVSGSVGESYGAYNLPAIYFIDSAGVIRSSSAGYLDEPSLIKKLETIVR